MPEFCFYQKGQRTRALKRSDADAALRLTEQGYEKQFEEINAADEEQALARFADIRKEKQIASAFTTWAAQSTALCCHP